MTSWNPQQPGTENSHNNDTPTRTRPARRPHRAERARKAATVLAGTGVAGLIVAMALTDHLPASQSSSASLAADSDGALSAVANVSSLGTSSTTSVAPTTTTTSTAVTEYIDEYGNIVDQYGNIISANTQPTVQTSPEVYSQPQVQSRGSG